MCRSCAEQESSVANYERSMARLALNKKNNVLEVANGTLKKGINYANSRESKLSAFSDSLFQKHFNLDQPSFPALRESLRVSLSELSQQL